LDSNPEEKDDRTNHEALPVEAGVKYGGAYKGMYNTTCV
jgi:hypothetical protein